MTKKRGKKERKEEKLKKKMQKDVLYNTPDTKTTFNVKMGKLLVGQNSALKMRVVKMLKWVIWGVWEKRKTEILVE